MKQLFQNLDINNYTVDDIQKIFLSESTASDINITFKWTPGRRLVFFKLHLKVKDKKHNLLGDNAVNTKSGSHTFFVGSFTDGDELEISYGIKALVQVPKIVTLLTQTNPTVAYQASPIDPTKANKIESGADLDEAIKHTVQ